MKEENQGLVGRRVRFDGVTFNGETPKHTGIVRHVYTYADESAWLLIERDDYEAPSEWHRLHDVNAMHCEFGVKQ